MKDLGDFNKENKNTKHISHIHSAGKLNANSTALG
jgi:hypothetical protein